MFRLVEIQPVPVGDPTSGVQQVKAVVTVEEYRRHGRCATASSSKASASSSSRSSPSTRNLGVVGEVKNPNLFGRALTGGLFGMYQRDRQDASAFLATSRLFGWRARSTLYGFYSRDRLLDDAGVDVDSNHRSEGRQRRPALAARASRSSTAIASSATTRSIPRSATILIPLDVIVNLAKLSTAVAVRSSRRSDQLAQGVLQFGVVRPGGVIPRLGRE